MRCLRQNTQKANNILLSKHSSVIPPKCLTVHPWISSGGYPPDGFTIFESWWLISINVTNLFYTNMLQR